MTARGFRRLVRPLHACQELDRLETVSAVRQSYTGPVRPDPWVWRPWPWMRWSVFTVVLLAAFRWRQVLYLIGLEFAGTSSHEASSGGSGEIAPPNFTGWRRRR
jgi:hypothetical protein